MMSAARELSNQDDLQTTYDAAVELAAREIDAADLAALTIVRSRRQREVFSPAATDPDASRADLLQYELDEGPCLEATWDHRVVHSPDLPGDSRWPSWGLEVATTLGLNSMLCFQLFTDHDTLGALNLYSRRGHAFGLDDRDLGAALAAHIAVATRAAQEKSSLQSALESRTTIGVAVGIVMERYQLSQARAFELLTRLSSTHEVKLRDIARAVVETGDVPLGSRADPNVVREG